MDAKYPLDPSVVSMSGGSESEGGEWRRIYDLIEALLPLVEELAADRAQLQEISRTQRELSDARENRLVVRLRQAESSRTRWKTAYIELPLLANPKITELQETDLKDCRTCEDEDNSQLKIQQKEARSSGKNSEDITGGLKSALRKLRQACKTLRANKDKEISGLLGVKDFLWNKMRTIDKENAALLKTKEDEEALATEAAQKLQQNIEQLQVAAQHKDHEIGRSRAEAANANKRVLILNGKLLEMHSLVKEKNNEIQ